MCRIILDRVRNVDFLAPKTFKIIWRSSIFNLSVPDEVEFEDIKGTFGEGYSRNAACALNLISTSKHYIQYIVKILFLNFSVRNKNKTFVNSIYTIH